ncbi:hypothetical protein, partial [uncultured Porphyromonas sp.]|uniref:hypothetical protein n=1 Tax=uncultured Porphyromonas sp. TaxID=159274 RepID=UPI0026159495
PRLGKELFLQEKETSFRQILSLPRMKADTCERPSRKVLGHRLGKMKAMNLKARRITFFGAMRMSIDVGELKYFGSHRRGRSDGLVS